MNATQIFRRSILLLLVSWSEMGFSTPAPSFTNSMRTQLLTAFVDDLKTFYDANSESDFTVSESHGQVIIRVGISSSTDYPLLLTAHYDTDPTSKTYNLPVKFTSDLDRGNTLNLVPKWNLMIQSFSNSDPNQEGICDKVFLEMMSEVSLFVETSIRNYRFMTHQQKVYRLDIQRSKGVDRIADTSKIGSFVVAISLITIGTFQMFPFDGWFHPTLVHIQQLFKQVSPEIGLYSFIAGITSLALVGINNILYLAEEASTGAGRDFFLKLSEFLYDWSSDLAYRRREQRDLRRIKDLFEKKGTEPKKAFVIGNARVKLYKADAGPQLSFSESELKAIIDRSLGDTTMTKGQQIREAEQVIRELVEQKLEEARRSGAGSLTLALVQHPDLRMQRIFRSIWDGVISYTQKNQNQKEMNIQILIPGRKWDYLFFHDLATYLEHKEKSSSTKVSSPLDVLLESSVRCQRALSSK